MRGTMHFFTPYCHIWDDRSLWKICPVAPLQLYYMSRICLSISRNRLLLLTFQVLWLKIRGIIPIIKGSYMGLDQKYAPTDIVKTISAILCNFFHHLYGEIHGSISTWSKDGLLWITCSNYSIDMYPSSGYWIHTTKPWFMVTGILCPSDLVKWPVIP